MSNEKEENRAPHEPSQTQTNAEKLKLIADLESSYANAWEKARREQISLRRNMEIAKLEKTLNDCSVREKNEKRVHAELTTFLAQDVELIERKIKGWQERYDREKKTYEREIRKVRDEIETRRKELEELKEEYRSNGEFIETYLNEKEELRKQKELEKHMRRSAIRIQAWWRGVMVRRKLGPYRPEEKKKKRPPKTKK